MAWTSRCSITRAASGSGFWQSGATASPLALTHTRKRGNPVTWRLSPLATAKRSMGFEQSWPGVPNCPRAEHAGGNTV
jgi:hypothetical protein